MNEYVFGSNRCRAFILWGYNVYCTLFSFYIVEREEEKKLEKKREKENGKKILIHLVCFGRKRKRLERNIRRNHQFSTEMKDSRVSFVFFFYQQRKRKKYIEKKSRRNKGGKHALCDPIVSSQRKFR